jgi:CHAT domain-containing protein
VDDKSTAQFMAYFYDQLKTGHSKGRALQNAMLTALKDPKTRHPYYWAPFFLIGDYR